LIDEFLGLAYYKEQLLPVRIVRLFNTTGPRQSSEYGMVLPAFVKAALNNAPLIVHGDGLQRRCFCSVDDVVIALIKLFETPDTIGEIINIGSKNEISILELANRVKLLSNSSSKILFKPHTQVFPDGFEDMERRIPCINKAKKLLNWVPQKNLDQVVRQVIDYYMALK
jgi:UDP-glucose 4-epimerase